MRTSRTRPWLTPRPAGIAMAGLLIAGLTAVAGPSIASTQTEGGMHMSGLPASDPHMPGMHKSGTHMVPTDQLRQPDLTRIFSVG